MERQELHSPPNLDLMTDVAVSARAILGIAHEELVQPSFLSDVITDVHNQLYRRDSIRRIPLLYPYILDQKVRQSLNRHTSSHKFEERESITTVSDSAVGGLF